MNCGGIMSFMEASHAALFKALAMGIRLIHARWRQASGGGRWLRFLEVSTGTESRGLIVILFLKGFCAIQSKQLSAVSCSSVPVFGRILYGS